MPGAKIWTGTLSFVLVSIPVELISAVRHTRVSFRLMHKKDNALLQRRMYCPKHNTFVHPEHIVNGYEAGDDQYVIIRDEEYKALEPKRSQSIEINAFVGSEEIDSIYFDRPYYLLPRKGGAKSYVMLRQVMQETGKVGLARFVLHTREHLVAVRAKEGILELMTLHYNAQVRDTDQIVPHVKAQTAKVKSITEQIKKAKGKYDLNRYIDDHRRQILEFLEQKAKEGHTVTIEKPEEEEEPVEQEAQADLISILEESLAKVKSK
jgi:DNA end-binding protein Ku